MESQNRRTFLRNGIACAVGLITATSAVSAAESIQPMQPLDKTGPMKPRTVGILIFEDAEVLDFSGPFEVFAVASQLHDDLYFKVGLVAQERSPVRAINGMIVVPNHSFDELPTPDILVISGGTGSRRAIENRPLLEWTRRAVNASQITMAVCSGARILAKLGFLDGREATTHHQVFEHLAELAPTARLRRDVRFADTGKIITTGGITAGIDGSFHVVARLLGRRVAERTAQYMEYGWKPDREYPE